MKKNKKIPETMLCYKFENRRNEEFLEKQTTNFFKKKVRISLVLYQLNTYQNGFPSELYQTFMEVIIVIVQNLFQKI